MAQPQVEESKLEDPLDDLADILESDESGVKGLEFFKLCKFEGSGRGLVSLLSRQPGEELFSIPLKYCITDYKIDQHPQLSQILVKHPKLLKASANNDVSIFPFMLLFYYEMINPSSKFKQVWLHLFPRNLHNFTIAWSDAELKACGILCPIRRLTVEIQVWIKKCFQTLRPIVAEFDHVFHSNPAAPRLEFSEELCEFICMMCRSRGCRLNLNPEDSSDLSHCFVPIGDFGNHKIGANSLTQLKRHQLRTHMNNSQNDFISLQSDLMNKKFFEYDFGSKCVIVRSQEIILANEQVCYEYTAAPNWELLANFGFCVPYNPYDRVIVSITFEVLAKGQHGQGGPRRLQRELKILSDMGVGQFLRKMDPQGRKYSLAIALTLQDPLPTILVAANRIKLLSDEQLGLLTVKDIANMDGLILDRTHKQKEEKRMKKKKGKDLKRDLKREFKETKIDSDDRVSLDKMRSLEWIVLKELKSSISALLSNYATDEPVIDKKALVHETDVKVVYQSIRQILTRAAMTVDERIQSLSNVMDKSSSSESESDFQK